MKLANFLVIAATSIALCGCASDGHKSGMTRSGFNDDVDYAKMAIITRQARLRGYDIVWINPPLKEKAASSESP